ncbi:MAG: hypothetical protein L0I76_13110 [Pseudonocardia sp.]|nr:hypothetical protein [Pseudonocardia sp.]
MNDATPHPERAEPAEETIADLTAGGDVGGGHRAIYTHPCAYTDDDFSCGPGTCVPPPKCED